MRRFSGSRLVVATHNRGKLDEIGALLTPYGVTVIGAAELGLTEPIESADSFVGNARIKAHAAAGAVGLPALADDSGLEVAALNGAPGVRTADWAEGAGGRNYVRGMTRVHAELVATGRPAPWFAKFCCTLVLAWPDGGEVVVNGEVAGQIVWPMRGSLGHGYDPIFQPDGSSVTFAEMGEVGKNAVSHRALAFEKLRKCCFA